MYICLGVMTQVNITDRSYATQKSTFAYWVKVDGLKKAEMYSARAGKSEHQTGK